MLYDFVDTNNRKKLRVSGSEGIDVNLMDSDTLVLNFTKKLIQNEIKQSKLSEKT